MRVLDTIPLDKDHFVSRYSNVAYHQRQQYINSINLPYPIFSDKEVTFPKDVLVIPYIEKYFHNFLEFIPKILFLLQQHQKFTVIVVVDKDIDYSDELKIPYGWIKSDDGQDSSYFKEMLDNLKVDYMCVKSSSDFYKNLVARSAYIFFDRKEFLFDKKLNRNYPEEMYFKTFSPFEACVTQTIDLLVGHVEILRSWFPRYKSKGKKIYISRKNFSDRKIKNEEFLEKFFEDHGYEIVHFEDFNIVHQLMIAQEASHIVSQSGSCLINCMFANPESKILEIGTENYEVGIYSKMFSVYNIGWTKKIFKSQDGESIVKEIMSDPFLTNAFVAQRTEQDSSKVLVVGSTPTEGAK